MLIPAPEVPLPSRDAVDAACLDLGRRLGDSKVTVDRETREAHGRDDSAVGGRTPDVVVFAASTDDVRAVLEIAHERGVPVTPRAAGTGRTGGAVPAAGGIVLATHALGRIKEIDRKDLVAVVEPGVVTGALFDAVESEGLFYPPDPNSHDACMIGGNVAENAGGPRAFKYGVTRDYVLGLEACLVGGRMIRTGKRTVKGVTGYDVTALLVGSEGTLAVFSEITLRLLPKPPAVATVLALYESVAASAEAIGRILAAGLVPRCMELLDGATLDAVRSQGNEVDPRARAMLLLEIDGPPSSLAEGVERLGEAASGGSGVVDVFAAEDKAARDRLWTARKSLSKATRKLARHKLSEDIVVPRSQVPEILRRVDRIGERTGVRHLAYGHAGDGNLHVNFLWDDDGERDAVNAAIEMLMRETVALRGTLSGEHGIGGAKAAYLPMEQSEDLIALQKDLKAVFDPKGVLNPGKIFPVAGHKAC
ncbi:MAG: FAD-linked oxidase C-terminal domain-containing protein [Polyangiaceae bacterium]